MICCIVNWLSANAIFAPTRNPRACAKIQPSMGTLMISPSSRSFWAKLLIIAIRQDPHGALLSGVQGASSSPEIFQQCLLVGLAPKRQFRQRKKTKLLVSMTIWSLVFFTNIPIKQSVTFASEALTSWASNWLNSVWYLCAVLFALVDRWSVPKIIFCCTICTALCWLTGSSSWPLKPYENMSSYKIISSSYSFKRLTRSLFLFCFVRFRIFWLPAIGFVNVCWNPATLLITSHTVP